MDASAIDGPRRCEDAELSDMIALADAVMREGSDQSFLTDYPLVYAEENRENIRILKADGEMAAVVPFIPRCAKLGESRFDVGIISPTATSPRHRKKGYATLCLQDCLAVMARKSIDLSILWTLPATFPFYEGAGYRAAAHQGFCFSCTRDAAVLFADHGETIEEYDPKSGRFLDDLIALHGADPNVIERTPKECGSLFALPKIKTFLAIKDSRPAAYLMVGKAINKPGIVEGAGNPASLETLLCRTLKALEKDESLKSYSYRTPSVLGGILETRLADKKAVYTAGSLMVRINAAESFVRKISRFLEVKNVGKNCAFSISIPEMGEGFSVRMRDGRLSIGRERCAEHYEMTRSAFTAAIFGSHPERPEDVPQIPRDFFALDFPVWTLDRS